MAKYNPALQVNPSAKERFNFAKSMASLRESNTALRNLAVDVRRIEAITGGDLENIANVATDMAIEKYDQENERLKLEGKPPLPEAWLENSARNNFEDLKSYGPNEVNNAIDKLSLALSKGAAAFQRTPEQQQAFLNNAPWAYNELQARLKLAPKAARGSQHKILTSDDPITLAEIAADFATKNAKEGMPEEELHKAAKIKYEELLAESGYTPELAKEYQDLVTPRIRESDLDRGWVGTATHAVTAPDRAVLSGAVAAPLAIGRELTRKAPVPEPVNWLTNFGKTIEQGADIISEKAIQPAASGVGRAVEGILHRQPILSMSEFGPTRGNEPEKDTGLGVVASLAKGGTELAGKAAMLPARALGFASKALGSGTVGGVPIAAEVKAELEGGKWPEGVTSFPLRALTGTGGVSDPTSFAHAMVKAKEVYAEKAATYAEGVAKVHPEMTEEELFNLAKSKMDEYIDNDPFSKFIKNPALGQGAMEQVSSLFTAGPVSKALGFAFKGVGALAKGAARVTGQADRITNVVDRLKPAFRAVEPGQVQAERNLGETGKVFSEALDRARGESTVVEREVYNTLNPLMDKFDNLNLSAQEKEYAYNIYTQGPGWLTKNAGELSLLPEKSLKKLETAGEILGDLDKKHFALLQKHPEIWQKINKQGEVVSSNIREFTPQAPGGGYVPLRALKESPVDLSKEPAPLVSDVYRSPVASSTYKRTKQSSEGIPDPMLQWRRESYELAEKSRVSTMLQKGMRRGVDTGAIKVVKTSGQGAKPTKELQYDLDNLSNTSGENWTTLSRTMSYLGKSKDQAVKDAMRLVFKPGEKGAHQYDLLLPESAAKFVREHLVYLGGKVSAREDAFRGALKTFGDIWDHTITPINSINSLGMTVLGGPAYTLNNLAYLAVLPELMGGFKGYKVALPAILGELQAIARPGGVTKQFMNKFTREFMAPNGEKISALEMRNILSDMGLIDRAEDAWAMKIAGKGVLAGKGSSLSALPSKAMNWWAEHAGPLPGGIPVPKAFSNAMIMRELDNTQKLMAGLYFYEGKQPHQLDRLFKLVSEHAGNYNNLGQFEKVVGRNVLMFYPWTRYIFPYLVKTWATHPERIAPWVRAREYMDRTYGAYLPESNYGMADYLRRTGVVAPTGYQPRQEEGRGNWTAMLQVQDPVQMLAPYMSVLENTLGTQRLDRSSAAKIMQVAPRALIEMISGRDFDTDEELEPLGLDLNDMVQNFGWEKAFGRENANWLASNLLSPLSRSSTAMSNAYKLYYRNRGTPIPQLGLTVRAAGGRAGSLFSELLDRISGRPGASLKGPLGTQLFYSEETSNLARSRRKALK